VASLVALGLALFSKAYTVLILFGCGVLETGPVVQKLSLAVDFSASLVGVMLCRYLHTFVCKRYFIIC
jgi:hypothetical protein